MDVTIWLELILFVFLMGFSGFFSSSETALFSLSNVQLELMRQENHPRISLIEHMLSEPRRLIITILIGNELVNVAASVISAAVIIQFLGADKKWLNLFVMVPVLLVVGEITPKTLAIRNNVAFASAECLPIQIFAKLITPLRELIRLVSEWFISLIVGKARSRGNIVTEDLVRTLAHEAVGEGALDRLEAQLIDHIFEFGNKTLEDLMTPRSDTFYLSVSTPLAVAVTEIKRTWRTKVPVFAEHRDDIVGILHARDLLGVDFEQADRENRPLEKLVRQPYFVPESKPASELFHAFRERKLSIALVVDEFGGVTGLVTMEDLLECIFGDIPSRSHRRHRTHIDDLGDGRQATAGTMLVADFNGKTGASLPTGEFDTIGGLVLHEFGELPPVDAIVELEGLRLTVMEVSENRIKKVSWESPPVLGNDSTKPKNTIQSPVTAGEHGKSPPEKR
jgi:putative hemolysin